MTRVLIVEDDPTAKPFGAFLLHRPRHTLIEARDAETQPTPVQKERPQILMDLHLAGRYGFEATILLKRADAGWVGDVTSPMRYRKILADVVAP